MKRYAFVDGLHLLSLLYFALTIATLCMLWGLSTDMPLTYRDRGDSRSGTVWGCAVGLARHLPALRRIPFRCAIALWCNVNLDA